MSFSYIYFFFYSLLFSPLTELFLTVFDVGAFDCSGGLREGKS